MKEKPTMPKISDYIVRVDMDYEAALRAIKIKQLLAKAGYREQLIGLVKVTSA